MDGKTLQLTRTVPVESGWDVIVIGGGAGGIGAAVSAARAGWKTLLVEADAFTGGTAAGGLVVPMSGMFFHGKRVVGGIAWELVQRMERLGAAQVELPKGHVSFHPEYLKLVSREMLRESGAEVRTGCMAVDCRCDGERLTYLIVQTKQGAAALEGRIFIDATGDGQVCAMAGVPMQAQERPMQPLSLCFLLEGVDVTTPLLRDSIHHDGKNGAPSVQQELHAYLEECVAAGKLDTFGGPWFNTLVRGQTLAVNVTRAAANDASPEAMPKAEEALRRDMFTIVELLRARYPEFRSCQIVASGVRAGVRESRRICGMETVTGEDLLAGKMPACPVAHCAHPMDMHSPQSGGQTLVSLKQDAYVPHGALIPRNRSNLLTAGRCVSADQSAYASIRVQGTCMCLGQAAGVMTAQALRTRRDLRELPAETLREQMRAFVL